jgi:hypothetical protein
MCTKLWLKSLNGKDYSKYLGVARRTILKWIFGKSVCGVNSIPNRVLTRLPKCAKTFLTKVFYAVLRRQQFPLAWKNARVVSTLKPEKPGGKRQLRENDDSIMHRPRLVDPREDRLPTRQATELVG